MKPQPKKCENCRQRDSVVGLNGKWVCLECFGAGLKEARQVADRMAGALAKERP